jgi:hypothetical protein
MTNTLINIGLFIAYALVLFAVLGLIFFAVRAIIKDGLASSKGSLLGLAALAVVFVLSYLISSPDQGPLYEKLGVGPGASKFIGAGLITTYIIFLGFVVITIYTSVVKWFK